MDTGGPAKIKTYALAVKMFAEIDERLGDRASGPKTYHFDKCDRATWRAALWLES